MTTRIVSLALVAALVACGSGTIRTTEGPGAVSPAPPPAVVEPSPAPLPSPSPSPEAPGAAPIPTADTAGAGFTEPGTAVEIRRIGRWVSSGIRGTRRLVIRDPATWEQFWSELGAGVRPEVNFSQDIVIAVAAGERPSGGHDIQVREVTRAGNQLRIEVLETYPSTGCTTTANRTQPVDVVMVPAAGVTGWSFIDSQAVGPC